MTKPARKTKTDWWRDEWKCRYARKTVKNCEDAAEIIEENAKIIIKRYFKNFKENM